MLISDLFRWEAIFYDGKVALPHRIYLVIEEYNLQVIFADKQEIDSFNYADLELVQKPKDGLNAILRNSKFPYSQIIICKECFLELRPKLRKSPRNYKQILSILALITMVGALVVFIIPNSAPYLAKITPDSVRHHISELTLEYVSSDKKICYNTKLNQELDNILSSLKDKKTGRAKIILIQSDAVNAFALPDGTIIVLSGLITKAESPEEIAGVIAHELGHIAYDHPIQGAIRTLGITGVIDIVTGGGGTMIYLITKLYNNSYSRDAENEADKYSIKLMQNAGYNLKGMHEFFIRNKDSGINKLLKGGLQWVSTHPLDQERAALFEKYDKNDSSKEVMSSLAWQEIKKLAECSD